MTNLEEILLACALAMAIVIIGLIGLLLDCQLSHRSGASDFDPWRMDDWDETDTIRQLPLYCEIRIGYLEELLTKVIKQDGNVDTLLLLKIKGAISGRDIGGPTQ